MTKLSKFTPINDIWTMPYLPPIATETLGVDNASICLTNRIIGEWKFLHATIADIPSPHALVQDYDFSLTDSMNWVDVIAPAQLTMLKFDILNNVEYYYRRTVEVATNDNGRTLLLLEGVYCNSRIWVNNKYITTHIGGLTPFVVDITDYAKSGSIELVIGIADIEGKNKGTWNANGNMMSDAAWGSYYAHTNICGILRNITLYQLPNSYILSKHIHADMVNNYKDGELTIDLLLDADSDISLLVELYDANDNMIYNDTVALAQSNSIDNNLYNKVHSIDFNSFNYALASAKSSDMLYSKKHVPFSRPTLSGKLQGISLKAVLPKVAAWNSECPTLHKLVITLLDKGKAISIYTDYIGFRHIDYGGSNSTARNKVYVNGEEVKLRGVCRHDISHLYGRSLTAQDELNEILSYKRNNVNHVRTSHYPASQNYLQLCDKYGIYVELENAVCFKGSNGYSMHCAAEQLLQNCSEMIEFYYNNPSIIIWSIGNESGFEKSSGFRLSHMYMKEKDISRPTIFSYPFTVKSNPLPYDIFSKHYNKVYGNDLGNANMPKLHDEYAHIACYNLADLMRDNYCRIAWGESIKMGWENIFNADGGLGCALWGGVDDVFYLPSGISVAHQRHSSCQAVGYGEWGAILDVYKREKPEAYLTKKAFSPIILSNIAYSCGKLSFELTNRHDHTNANAVTCKVIASDNSLLYNGLIQSSIAPHKSGKVSINITETRCNYIDIIFYQLGYEIEHERHYLSPPANIAIRPAPQARLAVNNKDMMIYNGDKLVAHGGYVYVNYKPLIPYRRRIKTIDGGNTVIITDNYGGLRSATITITLATNGELTVSLKPSLTMLPLLGSNYGVAFDIDENINSVSWIKDTLYSYYPDDHLERPQGIAYLKSPIINEYGVLPEHSWKDDSYNYFLSAETGDERLLVSHDFKTTRSDIRQYSINFNDYALSIAATESNTSCFTKHSRLLDFTHARDKSIMTTGSWYTIHRASEKCCRVSRRRGSSMTFNFIGSGVRIYGTRSKEQGAIDIAIDGKHIKVLSTRSDICDVLDFMVLDTIDNLPYDKHTLTITLNDNKGVRISGFEAMGRYNANTVSQLHISRGNYLKSLAWGNYCGKKNTLPSRRSITVNLAITAKGVFHE